MKTTLLSSSTHCLPVYIAAAIAQANFWKTGWTGITLGIAAYVVPFVFAFHPALILIGSPVEILAAILTASVGVMFLATGCAGYLFQPLGWAKRVLLWCAGLLLLLPLWSGISVFVETLGLTLGILVALWYWSGKQPRNKMAGRHPVDCLPTAQLIRALVCNNLIRDNRF